jgi:hypothetical protein
VKSSIKGYILSSVLIVQSCAMSPTSFVNNRASLDDVDVCRRYEKDHQKIYDNSSNPQDQHYLSTLKDEVSNRGLSLSKCDKILSDNAANNAAIFALALAAAAAAYGGGGGGSTTQPDDSTSTDYYDYTKTGYAWDAFYDQYYNLVWRCRNKANGQFAYDYQCGGKVKVDTTWPDK